MIEKAETNHLFWKIIYVEENPKRFTRKIYKSNKGVQ